MKVSLVNNATDETVSAEIIKFRRNGTHSPKPWHFLLSNGHLITPYEFEKRWHYERPMQVLNIIGFERYGTLMRDLIYCENPLLKRLQVK